jgi:hypothetical protein
VAVSVLSSASGSLLLDSCALVDRCSPPAVEAEDGAAADKGSIVSIGNDYNQERF